MPDEELRVLVSLYSIVPVLKDVINFSTGMWYVYLVVIVVERVYRTSRLAEKSIESRADRDPTVDSRLPLVNE
jgi:hypothetical protein